MTTAVIFSRPKGLAIMMFMTRQMRSFDAQSPQSEPPLRAQGVEEIAQTAIGLLGNDLARQAMRQAQKNTINPYAARDIIDEVLRRG